MGIEAHVDDVGIAFLCCFLECLGKVHQVSRWAVVGSSLQVFRIWYISSGVRFRPVGVFLSLDTHRQIEYPDSSPGFVLRGQVAGGIGSAAKSSPSTSFLAFFLVLFRGSIRQSAEVLQLREIPLPQHFIDCHCHSIGQIQAPAFRIMGRRTQCS